MSLRPVVLRSEPGWRWWPSQVDPFSAYCGREEKSQKVAGFLAWQVKMAANLCSSRAQWHTSVSLPALEVKAGRSLALGD